MAFSRENTISLRIPCHFLRLFLVFRRENTIFLRLPCHFLRFFGFFVGKTLFSYGFRVISVGFQKVGYSSGKSDFPDNTIFLRVLCHFLRFCLVFPRETLFSYVFRVISRVFFWFFVGKHCFPAASVSFPQVFRRKTSITLVIPRENPIFLTFRIL